MCEYQIYFLELVRKTKLDIAEAKAKAAADAQKKIALAEAELAEIDAAFALRKLELAEADRARMEAVDPQEKLELKADAAMCKVYFAQCDGFTSVKDIEQAIAAIDAVLAGDSKPETIKRFREKKATFAGYLAFAKRPALRINMNSCTPS